MIIKNIPTKELKPYRKNTKLHDEKQIKNVRQSIKDFGFVQPLVVDKNNVVIIGHCRLLAAKRLKLEEVPCFQAEDLTPEQTKKLRILDNKTNESPWDVELLAIELADLDLGDYDLDFDLPEPEEELELIEDEVPDVDEEAEETRSHSGEIWRLGEHRLMVGDSTSPEDVRRLMGGLQADCCITDPPYNVDYTGKTEDALKIQNDKMRSEEFRRFLTAAFENMKTALKPGGPFYIWYASREHINFESALNDAGLEVRQQLIWRKNVMVLGRQDYQWKHEPCLYGWKDGAGHYFINDRTKTTLFEDARPEPRKMKKEELVAFVEAMLADKENTTIIHENKPSRSDLHPTMKPVRLIGRLMKNSSRPKQKVLDLFGGSGTTIIRAQQLNRACFMMEYDPHYADVIIERWERFTGEQAELLEP